MPAASQLPNGSRVSIPSRALLELLGDIFQPDHAYFISGSELSPGRLQLVDPPPLNISSIKPSKTHLLNFFFYLSRVKDAP